MFGIEHDILVVCICFEVILLYHKVKPNWYLKVYIVIEWNDFSSCLEHLQVPVVRSSWAPVVLVNQHVWYVSAWLVPGRPRSYTVYIVRVDADHSETDAWSPGSLGGSSRSSKRRETATGRGVTEGGAKSGSKELRPSPLLSFATPRRSTKRAWGPGYDCTPSFSQISSICHQPRPCWVVLYL